MNLANCVVFYKDNALSMGQKMLVYLMELRRRALQVVCSFCLLFGVCFMYAGPVFSFLLSPLHAVLPAHDSLIAMSVTAPLLTPLHVAADAAFLMTLPVILFHIWRFMAPGLYRYEQRLLRLSLSASLCLFAAGVLFCFYVVLPVMMRFFVNALPQGVRFMPDITYAVGFITRMLLVFGLCFQVPLICMVFVRLGLVSLTTLKLFRPYVIVSAFILGMLLTPPDVFSQIALAVPLCLLYELGLWWASLATYQSVSD